MKRPSLRSGIVACVLLCLVSGCGDSKLGEGEDAVRAYCEAVILAHRTHDTTALQPVTTPRELRKLFALIDIKKAAGLVLECSLEELTVTGIEFPNERMMSVRSTERWRYFDRPLKVGVPAGTEFLVEMDLVYHFVMEEGTWRMDQAQTTRHDYLEPAGHDHRQEDPHGGGHGGSS